MLFAGAGMLARTFSPGVDHEHWPISESESADLAKKTRKWLDTLDKKKLDKLEAKYGKYIPGGTLVVALGVLTVPKVVQSIDNHKSRKGVPRRVDVRPQASPPPEPAPIPVNGNGASAPAPEPAAPPREDDVVSPAARASAGRFNFAEREPETSENGDGIRPFRAADGRAFDFDAP